MKKRVLRIGFYSGIVLMLFILLFFLFRNSILRSIADDKIRAFEKRGLFVSFDELHFSGISSVVFNGFSLQEKGMPALVKWDSMKVTVSVFRLLTGDIKLNAVTAGDIHVLLIKNQNLCNYSRWFTGDTLRDETDTMAGLPDYRKLMSTVISKLSDLSPDFIRIKSIYLGSYRNSRYSAILIPGITYEDDLFSFDIIRSAGKRLARIKVNGKVEPNETKISAEAVCDRHFSFPFADVNYSLYSGFDTAVFAITYNDDDDCMRFSGYGLIKGLFVKNDRIAPDTVFFPPMYCNTFINAGSHWVELDSASVFVMGHLQLHSYIRYSRDTTRRITLRLKTGETESDYLFSSLPEGLFMTLKGIQTRGKLDFSLYFDVDLSVPDSLKLEAEMKREKFRIERFGNVNYAYINEPFTDTVYEKYGQVRSFEVGPANAYYTPFLQVSPHLVNAILCTEDGAFFQHRGFIPEAFRESLATNIKEKRFARGGSTITMQLVKNVFLSRNKNIARKAEEMLIVWLIENQGLVSKERMMEVYLNIIEWGPGIYGVGEAADYYFAKKPAALSLDESIFLASIIPIPKYYKSRFLPDGTLKTETTDFIRLIKNKMISKGMITPADTLAGEIRFRPELLKSLISLPDSVVVTDEDD